MRLISFWRAFVFAKAAFILIWCLRLASSEAVWSFRAFFSLSSSFRISLSAFISFPFFSFALS